MASNTLKDIWERIEDWPPDRQEAVARVLIEMEEQDSTTLSLSDSQVGEVEHRRAAPNRNFLTIENARKHFSVRA